jgi:hypothetical protein
MRACITVKNLAIQFTFSWFPVVIIRVAEVLIINTAFSATRLVTFAQRGANCCRGHDQLGPLVTLEVNLQFGTLQASGRGLGILGWSRL